MSQIDEDLKKQVLGHKHMPKFVPGIKATYWKPVARIDAAVATMKEYGRYE
jgi:hypothetical protein